MKKYIIKNCPAYCYLGKECHNEESQYGVSCCEITNCIMKKIVELCKENLNSLETYVDVRSLECVTLQNIIKLLDMQEVE